MQIRSSEDLQRRSEQESRFYKAIRGNDDACIERRMPKAVQFLVNETSLLGDLFVTQTIERSAVVDESDSKLKLHITYQEC